MVWFSDNVTDCSCDWATGECQGPIGCKAVKSSTTLQEDARDALRDCVSFLKGDISGSAQRSGIISQAEAILERMARSFD